MDFPRHYMGWDRPFSIDLAERLNAEAGPSGALDDWLVWVPSSRCARHVLNHLFSGETDGEEAFHPPRMTTPAQFVRGLVAGIPGRASESQSLYAWKRVLHHADPGLLSSVFPVIPEENRSDWAYSVARQMMALRDRLVEDGHGFRSVAASKLPHDQERWEVLGRMEELYLQVLEEDGLCDPGIALMQNLSGLAEALPYSRVIVAAIMNLSRRHMKILEALSGKGMQVEFHIPAPGDQAEHFDDLGRPLAGFWDRVALPDALIEGRLQRATEPRELVDRIIDLGSNYKNDVDALVVGSCESELSRFLVERSRLEGIPFYAPEGKPLVSTEWGRLIVTLDNLQRTGSLGTLFDLLNHSLFRKWAVREEIQIGKIQKAILVLRKRHIMTHLENLRDPALASNRSVGTVRDFVEFLERSGFDGKDPDGLPAAIWRMLATVANAIRLPEESRRILEQVEDLLQVLQSEFSGISPPETDMHEILLYQLESTQYYPERETAERPVSGWLELPWEAAPHLVILGLPDSQVPGPKSLDSFLTPVLCRHLGLYGSDEQSAFHAFRLRLILECRRKWGKLDIVLPDRGLDESPVLPSRFLFMAEEAEILSRVELLLKERPGSAEPLATAFGTHLRLPEIELPGSISVTAFRTYLASPFHFYLQHILGWQPPEELPREMDAMAFGNLAHAVLESLNGSDDGALLLRTREIEEFLASTLQQRVASVFGNRRPVSLEIQVASLRERLRVAAGIIASERQAGWLPCKVEWAFHKDLEWKIGGVQLRGKIDLLEYNEARDEYRIIDYKTSDKGTPPRKSHLGKVNARSRDPLFPETDFEEGRHTWRWRDLQLPLYRKAVEAHIGKGPVCAYFNLTKAAGETGLEAWSPSKTEEDSAIACARAIIERIHNGSFPVGKAGPYEDPWMGWFGSGYADVLDEDWLAVHGGVLA